MIMYETIWVSYYIKILRMHLMNNKLIKVMESTLDTPWLIPEMVWDIKNK
jgi:hypothetical protein